jgi:hypothetical protein
MLRVVPAEDSMIELKPGWADQLGAIMGGDDEQLRAESSGLAQRRCFRKDFDKMAASASKGGQKGAVTRNAKRKMSLGHLE